jgi:hypothetical protein
MVRVVDVVVPLPVFVWRAVPEGTPLNSAHVTMAIGEPPLKVIVMGLLVVSPLGTTSSYMNASKVAAEPDWVTLLTRVSDFPPKSVTDVTPVLGVTVNDTITRSPTFGWETKEQVYGPDSSIPAACWTNWTFFAITVNGSQVLVTGPWLFESPE